MIVMLALLGVLAFLSTCGATTWSAPQRPFSPEQWLEYDVSNSDAIGIGRVVAVHDTIVDISPKDGSGIPVRSLTLQVTKWLKGGQPGKAILEVGTSALDDEPIHPAPDRLVTAKGSGHSVLFFLRSANGGWGLCDGPDPAGAGLRLVAPSELAAMEGDVRRIVAQQAPDSLLVQADLVFLGHPTSFGSCGTTPGLQCERVAVDTLLAGSAPGGVVSVFAPLLGDVPPGPALYVLRATTSGYHEALGYKAGIQSIQHGRIQRWRLPVEAIRAKVQRAREEGGR